MSENVNELSSLVRINLQQPFPGSYKPSRNPYPILSAENGSGSFLYAICLLYRTMGAAILSNGMYKLSDVMDTEFLEAHAQLSRSIRNWWRFRGRIFNM